ncbi:MAG: reverse transcriptase family protein [Sphingomonadales bacterium]
MTKKKKKNRIEIYELERSPLAQKPTQRDLAILLGMKRDELRNLITHADDWIVRREEIINRKVRKLAYPHGKLRRAHEILKFHLGKIKQPDYLFSPRKKRSQRDNAARHLHQNQILTLDIKQFYPSTKSRHVYQWAKNTLRMHDDVAGLFTRMVTIDGSVSFGSPLTPVLVSLIHREIFDEIGRLCQRKGLKLTLWVDNITISGRFVPGTLIQAIREVIRDKGLKSHELSYWMGNRAVSITGIQVTRSGLHVPRSVHDKIRNLYEQLSKTADAIEAENIATKLLSSLGTVRYVAGKNTRLGTKTANKMTTLRRRRVSWMSQASIKPIVASGTTADTPPWD